MYASLKTRLWNGVIVPGMVRRGWRPAHCMPIDNVASTVEASGRFGYDDEAEIRAAVQRVKGNTMTSFERLATLWQQVRYLDRYKIKGDFVECGVWKGGSVGMMALAHMHGGAKPTRALHLFDSFEGLPEPDRAVDGDKAIEYSGDRAENNLSAIGKCVGPLDENKDLLESRLRYPRELVHYHIGWFQDSLPRDAAALGDVALLRLDGDWYDSTKICLEQLYSKVVKGGVIVIDDYGHWEGCKKAVDEFVGRLGEPVLLNHIDYTGRYWVKL